MKQLAVCFLYLIDCFNHMNRNSYCSCLIGNCTCDSLSNPPCSIGRKLKALCIIKLINCFNQTHIAFLNKIKELHSSAHISFGNAYNKTEVCLRKPFLCNRIIIRNTNSELNFLFRCKKRHSAYFFKINLNRIVHCSTVIRCHCIGSICILRKLNLKCNAVQRFC